MTIQPGEVYEHYKGEQYEIICLALLEANLTPMAVYKQLKTGAIFTRPVAEFEEVLGDKSEGTYYYRFAKVSPVSGES